MSLHRFNQVCLKCHKGYTLKEATNDIFNHMFGKGTGIYDFLIVDFKMVC